MTLVLWLKPNIRKTGEMQHPPKAIALVREVVAGCHCTRGRIYTAENHIKASAENIGSIFAQVTPASAGAASNRSVVEQAVTGTPARAFMAKTPDLLLDRSGRRLFGWSWHFRDRRVLSLLLIVSQVFHLTLVYP
jgi:hypothetical protein